MTKQSTLIVAEAGVNHNGSLDLALALVEAAASSGADFIKFQTFNAGKLVSGNAPKAAYQIRNTGAEESQLAMLERLQLSIDDHKAIISRCGEKGIRFLSTPFDSDSLALLTNTFGLELLKVGSGELTNGPFLVEMGRSGRRLILSTGMGTLAEVEQALGALAFGMIVVESHPSSRAAFAEAVCDPRAWDLLRSRVSLLHCTTEYPSAVEDSNLRAMDTMRVAFGLPVGYSDHTQGTAISVAAVARGAEIIEKHLTIDRNLPGPDHTASLMPDEFAEMVHQIRSVERALGTGIKQPSAVERNNRAVARKSVVAARNLIAGQLLNEGDLAIKRPGSGRSPMDYWNSVGTRVERDYSEGEPLDP